MHLLNLETLRLEEFLSDIPDYFILSHRWGEDEITYRDITTLSISELEQKKSWPKLLGFVNASRNPDHDYPKPKYGWVDTFCINKYSSAELSEAINSMFSWYRRATLCIAFLNDVSATSTSLRVHSVEESSDDFMKSVWFTRGWTLQELLAPKNVKFYNRDWKVIGLREDLASLISKTTGIDLWTVKTGEWSQTSVAMRMKWAAKRVTKRTEDVAYSLLGIFDINMPLLYGEGDKAFGRLQEAILMKYDDHSIFLWTPPDVAPPRKQSKARRRQSQLVSRPPREKPVAAAFALHPSWFLETPPHELFPSDASPVNITNQGVQITMAVIVQDFTYLGIVSCCNMDDHTSYLAIPLKKHHNNSQLYSRLLDSPKFVSPEEANPKLIGMWRPAKFVPNIRQVTLTRFPDSSPFKRAFRSIQIVLPEALSDEIRVTAVYPGRPLASNEHLQALETYTLQPSSPYIIVRLDSRDDINSGIVRCLFLFITILGGVVPYRYEADCSPPTCMVELAGQGPGELETPHQVDNFMKRAEYETKLPIHSLKPQDIPEPKRFKIGSDEYCATVEVMSLRNAYAGVCKIKSYTTIAKVRMMGLRMFGAQLPW